MNLANGHIQYYGYAYFNAFRYIIVKFILRFYKVYFHKPYQI